MNRRVVGRLVQSKQLKHAIIKLFMRQGFFFFNNIILLLNEYYLIARLCSEPIDRLGELIDVKSNENRMKNSTAVVLRLI